MYFRMWNQLQWLLLRAYADRQAAGLLRPAGSRPSILVGSADPGTDTYGDELRFYREDNVHGDVCTKTSEATVEPTPTRPPKDSGMTCYRDNNADGKWKTFTFAEGEAMYASTCDSGLQLITNGQGFIGGGGDDDNGLRMAFRWADDQSGCKGKQAFDLDKPCHQGFAAINDQCDAGYDSSYGGTYRMQTDYGCVQVSLGRSDTG
ncbi:hypothetical protein G7054_g1088 [Neopestalotiopsis clavispora]|nr:hypothetical protein G7054_g1088 [Neopestalotiopsis clavispora]